MFGSCLALNPPSVFSATQDGTQFWQLRNGAAQHHEELALGGVSACWELLGGRAALPPSLRALEWLHAAAPAHCRLPSWAVSGTEDQRLKGQKHSTGTYVASPAALVSCSLES